MKNLSVIGFRPTEEELQIVNMLAHDGKKQSDVLRTALHYYNENANNVSQKKNKKKTENTANDVSKNANNANKDEEDIYSTVYNELYNQEVIPLKCKIESLNGVIDIYTRNITGLENDKLFLQNQLNAVTLAKSPLLSRIKLYLLSRRGTTTAN